ncbi:hypothetical protein K439DRAFT_478454 [Ramaria rubella]|nr:hypothetical protein K439DRAFT_478454 [Ramaria rubella]
MSPVHSLSFYTPRCCSYPMRVGTEHPEYEENAPFLYPSPEKTVSRSKTLNIHSNRATPLANIHERIEMWLEQRALARELHLASSGQTQEMIDWSDPRIRRLSKSEQDETTEYWQHRSRVSDLRSSMATSQGHRGIAITLGNFRVKVARDAEIKQILGAELAKRELLAEQKKPEWMKALKSTIHE